MYTVFFCGLSCHSADRDDNGVQTTVLERAVLKQTFDSIGEAADQFSRWAKHLKSVQTVLLVGPRVALAAGEPCAASIVTCRTSVPPNTETQRWVWRKSLSEHDDERIVGEMNGFLERING